MWDGFQCDDRAGTVVILTEVPPPPVLHGDRPAERAVVYRPDQHFHWEGAREAVLYVVYTGARCLLVHKYAAALLLVFAGVR